MVKILGAIMTGFACGYLGFKISFAMKIRAESLNNIITSLEMLESCLLYTSPSPRDRG